MKNLFKNLICMTLSMMLCVCAFVVAFAENGADEYLASLAGTYEPLFPVMDREENKTIWYENFAAVLGVEDTETAEMLRQSIIGMFEADVYGPDAVALAKDDPTYGAFDCNFVEGVAQLKFEGSTITGYAADGTEVFSHAYTLLSNDRCDFGAMNEMYETYFTEEEWPTMAVYVSDGEVDSFKYFAFCGDTPAETFHIEFRYGASLDGIASYYDGNYAYLMCAGFLMNAPEGMMNDCINLFVTENAADFAEVLGAE